MTKKEKDILIKAHKAAQNEFSPADLVNGIAGHDQKSVDNLVIKGYFEEIPRDGYSHLDGTPYTINFYRFTEKGLAYFFWHKRIFYKIKTNIAIFVGISSIILGIASLALVYQSNQITLNDVLTRNRPYIGMERIDTVRSSTSTTASIFLTNTGNVPATNLNIEGVKFNQETKNGISITFPLNKNVILFPNSRINFPVTFSENENMWWLKFTVFYNGLTKSKYSTSMTIKFNKTGTPYEIITGSAN